MMRVRTDYGGTFQKIGRMRENAVKAAAEAALADCNERCPRQSGRLIASSYRNSDTAGGRLVWSAPYARRVYFTAGRGALWTEAAKQARLTDWQRAAQKGLGDVK